MSRRNPTGAPKKSRVKTVFPASNAATTAAGYAAVSGTADPILNRFRIFAGSEDGINSDIKPPLPVVDPERFYRSGEK